MKLLTTKSSLCAQVHTWRPKFKFQCHFSDSIHLVFGWFFTGPKLTHSGRLPGQNPGDHGPVPSSTGNSSMHHHTWLLPVYRNWTQVLVCARQAFYPLRHLSNRTLVILQTCIVLLWENKHHLFGQFFVYIQDIPIAEIRLHLTANKVCIMEKVMSVCLEKRTWGHH